MGIIADKIRRAIFGGEVRDSIADGIEVVEQLREDYDNQVINAGNSNAEIVDARGGQSKLKDRLDNFDSHLEQMEQDKATKLEVEIERKRIDNLSKLGEGSTTGDAELQDIRVGIDGISYDSAGNAVREQLKKESLKSDSIIDFNASVYPSVSKSGDFISITNGNNAPLTIKRKVKNLLPLTKEHIKSRLSWFTWTSDTEFNGDGIYYKINDNGTITANGTATKNIGIAICSIDNLDPNRIYCCSDKNDGTSTTYYMEFALERKDQGRGSIKSFDSIKTFNSVDKVTAWLNIKSGQTLNNVIFKPMLEVGEIVHTYVPYTNTKIISCKNNLLKFDTRIVTEKGVTVSIIDNSIHIKGTATEDISIYLGKFNAPEYQYTCFENRGETSSSTFYLEFAGGNFEQDRGQLFSYNTSEKKFSTNVNKILIWLNIKNGTKVNNILEPMISRDVLEYEKYYGNEVLITNLTEFPNKNLPTYKDLTNIFDTGGAILDVEYLENFEVDLKRLNEVAIKNNEILNEVGVYENFEGDMITVSEHDTNYFKITKANPESNIILCKNNFLKLEPQEIEVNGVVITVNEDSTISLKGTATSEVWKPLKDVLLPPYTYYCREMTGNTKNQQFYIQFFGTYQDSDRGYFETKGDEIKFASRVDKIGVVVKVESGVTVDVTLKPMISLENIEYEKYIGKEIKISDLKNDIFELFEGTNNIFSSDKSTIGVKLLKNTTQKFNKLEKEIKYNVNYNNVPLIKNKNGVRKSVNEDEQGNLKLFDISNNVIGRSKYNGNTYVVEYWGTELEIIDPNGARIFSKTISQAPLFLFNKVKNSKGQIRFTYGVCEGDSYGVAGFEPQKWNIVDENFSPIKEKITLIGNGSTITDGAACDNHVFNYIDDNHYIITGYLPYIADDIPGLPGRYKVVNCVIQEIKDNKVIFEWESKNHPELYTLSVESNKYETTPASGTSYSDYCHINAVATDKNNDFIISCRNVGIMKISRSTKSIEWLFGRGGRIDFTGMNIGDTGFLQHDIRIQKDGSITIFDNSGCATDNSRVCRYWLDENTMTMTKFKEYKTSRPRSIFMGSALLLDDETETFLISYGGQQGILYDEINFSTGETNMTVLSERTKGCSYCALRDLDEVKY